VTTHAKRPSGTTATEHGSDAYAPDPPNPEKTAMNSADPVRNFTLTVDERIRALTIGVPAWAARKRKIEDDQARFVNELVELHDGLVAKGKSGDEVYLALVSAATTLEIDKHNALIEKHNRYYPIEANLPLSLSGTYLAYGRPWLPEEKLTVTEIVTRAQRFIEKRDGKGDDA